jgi:hypothetical protein
MANNTVTIEEIPEIKFDYKYSEITSKRIKKIEAIIRKSYEYKIFIIFLKHTLDLNRCAYYEGYSIVNGFGIEIHHYPLTLYDITYIVANKHLKLNGFFETFVVAEEVTFLHYLFKIGVVPLNPTAHKLYHNGNLQIHPNLVKGDWNAFVDDYKQFIGEDTLARLKEIEDLKKTSKPTDFPPILHRNEQFLRVNGIDSISSFDIGKMLKNISLKKLEKY